MDNLLNSGLQLIQWFQALGTWLLPLMKFFTFLGSIQFYLLVAPLILWCIDAKLGIRLGLFLMINATVNAALKVAFHQPRPYWYSSSVKVFGSAENSFGAPSGHAQNAVIVWGTLADRIKTRAAWIVGLIFIFMIGISRLYLALHFPQDILLGWLFGAIMLWVFLRCEKPVVSWIKKFTIPIQIVLIFLFSLGLVLLVVFPQLLLGSWTIPDDWVKNASFAFPGEPLINPLSFSNLLTSTGAFFGLAAGWIWIDALGGFSIKGQWYKRLARYILGVVGVLILYKGLGYFLPEAETLVSYTLHYLQYALIGFWMSGVAPWLFITLKLATHVEQ